MHMLSAKMSKQVISKTNLRSFSLKLMTLPLVCPLKYFLGRKGRMAML